MKYVTRHNAKGYSEAGASHTKRAMKGFTAQSGSPREDIDFNSQTNRQRSRILYMAAPVATAAIKTNRTKVVGTGLTLKSTVRREILGISAEAAEDWQRQTESEFALWAGKKRNCDAIGVNNFFGLQQLALQSWLLSGDVFALIKRVDPTPDNPYTLRLHLIEADRVSTPDSFRGGAGLPFLTSGIDPETKHKIFDGVEVDKNGMIAAYHIRNTYPGQITAEKTEWARVEAYGKRTGLPNILQIMDSERPDQYRGVPYLAQVIEPLLQLRRYTESELMGAYVQSCFSAWVETEGDSGDFPFSEVQDDTIDNQDGDTEDPEDSAEYNMGPGLVNHLKKGEKVVFGNPNIPTAGFEKFVSTVCRLTGAALEIPYDVLVKEYNSSYSAARAALLEAWEAFRMRRVWFVDDFTQPVYELFLAEAVALGRIKAPGFFTDPLIREAWCGARWIGPVQGQIDPVKEAKAAVTMVNEGFKTREQVTRELGGGDWTANAEQLRIENELLKQARGKQITEVQNVSL